MDQHRYHSEQDLARVEEDSVGLKTLNSTPKQSNYRFPHKYQPRGSLGVGNGEYRACTCRTRLEPGSRDSGRLPRCPPDATRLSTARTWHVKATHGW